MLAAFGLFLAVFRRAAAHRIAFGSRRLRARRSRGVRSVDLFAASVTRPLDSTAHEDRSRRRKRAGPLQLSPAGFVDREAIGPAGRRDRAMTLEAPLRHRGA